MQANIVLLPGDGIGPEVVTQPVRIEKAVDETITAGCRTADIGGKLGTHQMADEIIARL